MRRRFIDAHKLLHHLLDRQEAGVETPAGYPDYQHCPSVPASDAFAKELRRLAQSGAIAIVDGKGSQHDQRQLGKRRGADFDGRHAAISSRLDQARA